MIRLAAQYFFSVLLFCNISIAAFNPLTSQIQTYLREMQIDPGQIDGLYGPNTKAAIIKFQKLAGLTPNGIADKMLLQSLRRYYALYTDQKYSYNQDQFHNYQYSETNNKCQRSLNELSSYSDQIAKYNYNTNGAVYYDSRWGNYSPRYHKRHNKISKKLSKLDRLMRRVHANCKKSNAYTKNNRRYQPRYVQTQTRRNYIQPTPQYIQSQYEPSPFLDSQENKMYRLHR